jgi:hypothetical protein
MYTGGYSTNHLHFALPAEEGDRRKAKEDEDREEAEATCKIFMYMAMLSLFLQPQAHLVKDYRRAFYRYPRDA